LAILFDPWPTGLESEGFSGQPVKGKNAKDPVKLKIF
jgi:hypothetical protein